jgi:methionyl-tRNA synthetase
MKKYYITTPIYYINDVPHIGHAYTTIAADVLARYHKLKGEEVFFLTGTDEHGAKIAEAAKKAGKEPKEFVDSLVPKFKDAWKKLNIEYSEFFRTTDPEHEKMVQEFVAKLNEKGLIEKKKYEGLYCVGCERYLKSEELIDGKCPDHKTEPVKQSEENYFFKLSQFGDQILAKIKSGELEVGPDSRKNEVLGKINQGLEDISISRSGVEWGIKFPGDDSQTIYVWVDALLNYYTATKIYKHEDIWPADLHLMAKDILWFHAIIWPAMLLALDLPVPKKVFAHGFFTVNNQKMSKSIGNVLDPVILTDKYGADAVRFAVLREFPFGEDGDISEEKISLRYIELANNIGNLVQRTLVMIGKYQIPKSKLQINSKTPNPKFQNITENIENLKFNEALMEIMKFAESANKYIAEREPWTLAKAGKTEELTEVLVKSFENISNIADYLLPFMPETSEKIKKQLETLEPEVLFPKLA